MKPDIAPADLTLAEEITAAVIKAKEAGVPDTYIVGCLERTKITSMMPFVFAAKERFEREQASRQ